MVQIRWTSQAVVDLKSIYEYISKDSKKYAKIQIIKLRSRTTILRSNPFAGKIVPELNQKHFRELIEGNFRIIYKVVAKDRIDIITIHHTARDLSKQKL